MSIRLNRRVRNILLHAEKWVRLSNQICPDNASLHGSYEAISLLVTTLRETGDEVHRLRQHRSDCKHCKAITATAEKHVEKIRRRLKRQEKKKS